MEHINKATKNKLKHLAKGHIKDLNKWRRVFFYQVVNILKVKV